MTKLKITKKFDFAHRGCDVVTYEAGKEIETDDKELISTVLDEKWGTKVRTGSDSKAQGNSPENKALTGSAENKGSDESQGETGSNPLA